MRGHRTWTTEVLWGEVKRLRWMRRVNRRAAQGMSNRLEMLEQARLPRRWMRPILRELRRRGER